MKTCQCFTADGKANNGAGSVKTLRQNCNLLLLHRPTFSAGTHCWRNAGHKEQETHFITSQLEMCLLSIPLGQETVNKSQSVFISRCATAVNNHVSLTQLIVLSLITGDYAEDDFLHSLSVHLLRWSRVCFCGSHQSSIIHSQLPKQTRLPWQMNWSLISAD